MNQALSDATDERLLERYREGDLAALERLLARYETPLYNFIARQVRNQELARDLLQDVLVRLVQHADGFRGQARVRTWLYKIARNACIDHGRRQVHRRHASLDASRDDDSGAQTLHDRIASNDVGADGRSADRQLAARIEHAVAGLPEEQREVFLMRQVQGLPFKEIAEVTGVSENTAKSRMRYALERLQAQLQEFRDSQRSPA